MCLQEVDRFHDLEEELAIRGYTGIWKMRTGNAIDGCAIFWRTNRFRLRHEEHIEFNKLGLRDNVAQICVLESRFQYAAENQSAQLFASPDQSGVANQVVICNIHVLYNPKRGEIKLGQVRMLLDRAYAVSRLWNDAPVVICGDFNCTPQSPLYKFISEQKLNLSGLARNQVSGQHSGRIYSPRPYIHPGSYGARPPTDNSSASGIGVKQGSCYIGSDSHRKPVSDIEKASLTEEFSSPPSLTSILNMPGKLCSEGQNIIGKDIVSDAVAKVKDEADTLKGWFSDSTSQEVRLVDSSNRNGESNKRSEIPANIESGNQLSVTSKCDPSSGVQLDCEGSDHSTGMVHSVHSTSANYCYQSSANKSSELINSPDVDTSLEDQTQKLADLSAEEKGMSQYFEGTSIMSTAHKDLTAILKADLSSNRSQSTEVNAVSTSGMPSEKALLSEALPDSELLDDDITGVSSLQMPSRGFSANIEVSVLENMEKPSDLITELTVDTDTPCQNSSVNRSSDLPAPGSSSLGLKLDDFDHTDVHKVLMEDADLRTAHGISSPTEKHSQVQELATKYVNSRSSDNYNISSQAHAAETGRSFVKSFSADQTNCGQSENNVDSVESGSTYDGLSSSEENSDPNFFKDLLGSEDACEQDFSSLHGSIVGEGEVNGDKLGFTHKHEPELDSSDQNASFERHYYDPYLWTPMEIEIASGNAECTFIEHNLKLRSAYTNVEDYTGTKDSSREPQVTSYNRQFMGTVDYIWCSEGLETVKVLDTIPKHVLRRTPGYPTPKWGSDHLALACQLAFTKGFRTSR